MYEAGSSIVYCTTAGLWLSEFTKYLDFEDGYETAALDAESKQLLNTPGSKALSIELTKPSASYKQFMCLAKAKYAGQQYSVFGVVS